MIVDTSALLAFYIPNEPAHSAVRDAVLAASDDLVVSPYVLAEVDYLVATREGVRAELVVLDDLSSGAWTLDGFDAADVARARRVIEQYLDKSIGLADASNVVLAERHRTQTIATLDRRHFEVLRPLRGGRFTIVP